MKRDTFAEPTRPMDWQDQVVIKGCIFVSMAFAWFVFVRWIN